MMQIFYFVICITFIVNATGQSNSIDHIGDVDIGGTHVFTVDGKCTSLVTWDYRQNVEDRPTTISINSTAFLKRITVVARHGKHSLRIEYAKNSDRGIYRCWCWHDQRRQKHPIRLKEIWLGAVNSSRSQGKFVWEDPYAEIITDSPAKLPLHANAVYKCGSASIANSKIGPVHWDLAFNNATSDRYNVTGDVIEVRDVQRYDDGTELICKFDSISYKKSSRPFVNVLEANYTIVIVTDSLNTTHDSTTPVLPEPSETKQVMLNSGPTKDSINEVNNGVSKWFICATVAATTTGSCFFTFIAFRVRKYKRKRSGVVGGRGYRGGSEQWLSRCSGPDSKAMYLWPLSLAHTSSDETYSDLRDLPMVHIYEYLRPEGGEYQHENVTDIKPQASDQTQVSHVEHINKKEKTFEEKHQKRKIVVDVEARRNKSVSHMTPKAEKIQLHRIKDVDKRSERIWSTTEKACQEPVTRYREHETDVGNAIGGLYTNAYIFKKQRQWRF